MKYRRTKKRDYTLAIYAFVGIMIGISFGILGTVSKGNYLEYEKERNVLLNNINLQENKIKDNNTYLMELKKKEDELLKFKEELIEKEKKLSSEQSLNKSDDKVAAPTATN